MYIVTERCCNSGHGLIPYSLSSGLVN